MSSHVAPRGWQQECGTLGVSATWLVKVGGYLVHGWQGVCGAPGVCLWYMGDNGVARWGLCGKWVAVGVWLSSGWLGSG